MPFHSSTTPGRLGVFFTEAELTRSDAAEDMGLDNTPDADARAAIEALVVNTLDPFRRWLGLPVIVTSGYRSPAVNRAVGGDPKSQHQRGEAADIKVKGHRSAALAVKFLRSGVSFDQCIWYDVGHDPIHVSFTTRRPNRRLVLYKPKGSDDYFVQRPPGA